jgi:phosphoglycerate dehydrogenase-like enzyme
MLRVAVLDDYQGAAKRMADWSRLEADVEFFQRAIVDEDALATALASFDVVCLMRERTPFPASLLARLPRLRLLVFTGLGNTRVDLEAAAARGITVCNTRGGDTRHCTAELTWALILAAARHVALEDRSLRNGGWQVSLGTTLHGRTLGILGLGRLGSRVAEIGRAFGMQVLAWSPRLDDARAEASGARRMDLNELLAQSDVVSVHLALNEDTRHLLNAERLSRMRADAILVNTARGEIIDEDALVAALRERRLAGAGLDVFAREPLPAGHPLLKMDQVVLTPHLGYVTAETYRIFFHDVVEDIAAFAAGQPRRVVAAPGGKAEPTGSAHA